MNQQPDPAERSTRSSIPEGNGDRIRLARYADGAWQPPIDVTDGLRDVWRPTVAVDGDGARPRRLGRAARRATGTSTAARIDPENESWSDEVRVTDAPGTDFHVVAATDGDGTVWLAWQGWRDGDFDILARPIGRGRRRAGSSPTARPTTGARRSPPAGRRGLRRLGHLRPGQLRRPLRDASTGSEPVDDRRHGPLRGPAAPGRRRRAAASGSPTSWATSSGARTTRPASSNGSPSRRTPASPSTSTGPSGSPA